MVCVEAEEMRRRRGSLDGNDAATTHAVMMWEIKSAFNSPRMDFCTDDGGCPYALLKPVSLPSKRGMLEAGVVLVLVQNSAPDTARRERLALGFGM